MNNVIFPFEGFYDKAKSYQPPQPKIVEPSFDLLNKDNFKSHIPSISLMDEHALSVLIKNNIDIIANDILKEDPAYVPLLVDKKFIASFIRAINSIPIDYSTKLACNKITYDYFTSEDPDTHIKSQYLNMSRTINRETINKLIGIGLSEIIACNLALCRYSSSNEKTNVKRLNFAIYNRDPNIMTEQMIIWIYEKMFNRILDLFLATMFEVYSIQQQTDFGENFMEVYGTVGLAVLTIFNNMTSENIRKALIAYNEEWNCLGRPAVRFSLHRLSSDYSKITRVVDYLSSIGVEIP